MPLPRFRIRTLMIAVAVVALALAGLLLWRTSARLKSRAVWHGEMAVRFRDRAEWAGRMARKGYASEQAVTHSRDTAEYHTALQQRYEYASRRPWLPVAPDPPEPE